MAFWPVAPGVIVLAPALLVHGAGHGLYQVGYTDHIVAALHARDRGVAGSLTVLTRTIGVTLSAVALTSVLHQLEARAAATGQAAPAAFHAAFQTLFLWSGLLLAAFVVFSLMRRKRR